MSTGFTRKSSIDDSKVNSVKGMQVTVSVLPCSLLLKPGWRPVAVAATSIVMLGIIQALSLLQVLDSKVVCTADFANTTPKSTPGDAKHWLRRAERRRQDRQGACCRPWLGPNWFI